MNIKEIQDLIKFVSRQNVTEVEIEQKDFKITIKSEQKYSEGQPFVVQAPAAPRCPSPSPRTPNPVPR